MPIKKILIITGVFYPEPVVSAGLMKDLAMELSKNYKVIVLRPKPSRPMGFEMPEYSYSQFPFEVIELDSYTHPASSLTGRLLESYSMGKCCVNYIEKKYNELCLVYNGPWHMVGRNMVAKRCMKYHIPYITPVQDIYPESLSSKFPNISFIKKAVNRILIPSDRYLLGNAVKIHTISDKMVEYLSRTRQLPKNRFFVVRNWQDETAFVEYTKNKTDVTKKEKFTFMYLGNIGPLAGIDVLFDAFLKANIPEARLVVAGSGSAKENLQRKAKDYSCNIEFWDVPSGKVPETQAKADVMLLPVKKGFAMSSIPSKLPAYMFSAKPIIACVDQESDTAKCIIDGQAGWVVEPEDAIAIAKAMASAKNTSSTSLTEMGLNGFNYAMSNLSKGKNLQKLVATCTEVIDK